MIRFIICIFGLLAYINASPMFPITASDIVPSDDDSDGSYRLPNNTMPLTYDLWLQTWIHEGNFEYVGKVKIELIVLENTNEITLHSRNHTFTNIVLESDQEIEIESHTVDPDTEFLVIKTTTELIKDTIYFLSIDFSAVLGTTNVGWYRASYEIDGEIRWLATSDFEAPDARQAFPCYDEPDRKANFTIAITHSSTYTAISNMIGERGEISNGIVTTTFGETPKMSTYLLAFIVSDFEARALAIDLGDETFGTPHRIWARPDAQMLTRWALETGVYGLLALEESLNVPYALPKMDQIAIPDKDFASGAMENWGLVTYRESRLLLDEYNYEWKEKDYVGTVILHEFAHQWFGDLVSPKWWTYLWLNEGFATLFEYWATDLLYPDMRLKDLMVLESIQGIMVSDASDNPRPMTHYVETRTDIRSLFNYVSYQKAGAVLRMMMHSLGEKTFLNGLTYYQTEMAYGNAVAEDLFRGLQKSVDDDNVLPEGLTIEMIMNSWSLQGGYPLITVNRETTNKVKITQKRFILSNPDPPASNWFIPITYTISSQSNFDDTTAQTWFRGNMASFELTINEWTDDEWIILNKQQAGYYRVNYDENNWLLIARTLNSDQMANIHLLNRAQLVDDALDLAQYGHLDLTVAMEVVDYLRRESDYVPWAAAEPGLNYFYNRMVLTDYSELFMNHVKDLIPLVYRTYEYSGHEDDVYFTVLARNLAIKWACMVGYNSCRLRAAAEMKSYINDNSVVGINYRATVYCAGMRSADKEDFISYHQRLDEEITETARNAIIDNLICSENTELLRYLLDTTMNSSFTYTNTEKIRIYRTIYTKSLSGYKTFLNFLEDNADLLQLYFTSAQVRTIILGMAQQTYSVKSMATFQEIMVRIENYIGNDAITTAEESMEANKMWIEKFGKPIYYWLGGKDDNGSAGRIISSTLIIILSIITIIVNM